MKKLLLLLLLSLGLIGISYADDSQEAIEREIAEFEAELAAELALEEATIEAIRARLLAQEKTICHPPQGVEQKIAELKAAAKAEAIARLEAEQAALEAELAAQEMMAEIEAECEAKAKLPKLQPTVCGRNRAGYEAYILGIKNQP